LVEIGKLLKNELEIRVELDILLGCCNIWQIGYLADWVSGLLLVVILLAY
jgi:hypothetical protein